MLYTKDELVKKVQEVVYEGCGLNPLVGSGASSASGIIMGLEFADYLAYVVQQATRNQNAWNLRKNNWPPYPTTEVYSEVRKWVSGQFREFFGEGSPYQVEYDGEMIKRITPKTSSLSEHLNCPGPPSSLRSPKFTSFDPGLYQVNTTIKGKLGIWDPYEPLWLTPEVSPTSHAWLREVAVRSLSDWRATLRFLSRLKKDRSDRVVLSKANPSVIDRFNTFITSDRQPNLAHKMLAALARPLRMRTVLTTNFDTLLEDAFLQSGHYLKKFFVSRRGKLPDPFLVRAQPAIIKLHGELLETRADFSLDGDPAIQEKKRFLQYFVDTQVGTEVFNSMLSHALVIGYSGNDIRTIRMLQYLLDETAHFKPENQPRIFWICVSDGDVWRVNKYFERYPEDRVVICQTDRPDLLLLELYQKIALSIPVAGQTYEYNHNVPPVRPGTPPTFSEEKFKSDIVHSTAVDAFSRLDKSDPLTVQKARDALASVASDMLYSRLNRKEYVPVKHLFYDHFKVRNTRQIAADSDKLTGKKEQFWSCVSGKLKHADQVLFFDAACGALESLSLLHYRLAYLDGKRCLWFELADYINSDGLLRDILRSIALRTGRFQREHVTIHPLNAPLKDIKIDDQSMCNAATELSAFFGQLAKVHRLTLSDWPILIYGRDLAGTCVNWRSAAWSAADWGHLFALLGGLAMAGFPVLLAHSSGDRLKRESEKTERAADWAYAQNNVKHPQRSYKNDSDASKDAVLPLCLDTGVLQDERLSSFELMRNEVYNKCIKESDFRDFIYAICLFRQSRRPSALFYEAVQPCSNRFNLNGIDNDIRRANFAEKSIDFLEVNRVFYTKAGGSSWMHRDIRVALQVMLDKTPMPLENTARKKVGAKRWRWHSYNVGRSHFWVGDWYEKAFNSTGFAKPAIEALHHYFQAARLSIFAIPKGLTEDDKVEVSSYRFLLLRSALNAMTKLLLVSRPFLKLWIANLHGFPMFHSAGNQSSVAFDDLVHWLWQEESSSAIHLSKDQKTELGYCFRYLQAVIQDTQRSIRNEADLQISTEIDLGDISLDFVAQQVGEKLSYVLQNVYAATETWNKGAQELVNSVAQFYGHGISSNNSPVSAPRKMSSGKAKAKVKTSSIEDAFRSCIPCGSGSATITQEEHAKEKGIAIAALSRDFKRLPSLLAVLEALAYAQMRRAKFSGHATAENETDAWRHVDVRNEWLRLTRICNLGIDWCKHLSPHSLRLDLELRIRLHSYYAVALANLDRFYEAHRHLTEALAIQSKNHWNSPKLEQAKLSLRRAEVILTEAHRIGLALKSIMNSIQPDRAKRDIKRREIIDILEKSGMKERIDKPTEPEENLYDVEWHPSLRKCLAVGQNEAVVSIQKLRRLLVSMLDDAWFSVENAERALSGSSQSSLWWGRLALLKLRACGYQVNLWKQQDRRANSSLPELKMLAYRHRRINPQAICQVYESARLNDKHADPNMRYREFRLVRYMANCLEVFAQCDDELPTVWKVCSELHAEFCTRNKADRGFTAEMDRVYENTQTSVCEVYKFVRSKIGALDPLQS